MSRTFRRESFPKEGRREEKKTERMRLKDILEEEEKELEEDMEEQEIFWLWRDIEDE